MRLDKDKIRWHPKTCYDEYAITLTYNIRPANIHLAYTQLINILSRCKTFIRYSFYPEYSPNGTHHLHWHGYVYTQNRTSLYSFLSNWRKYRGYTDCKYIKSDIERIRWHVYIKKTAHELIEILPNNNRLLKIYYVPITKMSIKKLRIFHKNRRTIA